MTMPTNPETGKPYSSLTEYKLVQDRLKTREEAKARDAGVQDAAGIVPQPARTVLGKKEELPYKTLAEYKAARPKQESPWTSPVTKNTLITKEENKMSHVLDRVIDANKAAAVSAAKVTLGNTAIKVLTSRLKPFLPAEAAFVADLPAFEVAVANVAVAAVAQFAPNHENAELVSEAMLNASMNNAFASLNIEELVVGLLDSIAIPQVLQNQKKLPTKA